MSPRMGGYVPADHKTRHQDGGRDEISIADLAGTPTELTTHAADLDAHTYNLFQKMRTGAYYSSQVTSHSGSTGAITANRLYAYPIVIARPITIDAIQMYTSQHIGNFLRMGIYNDGTNMYPGTLLADYGAVALDPAAGYKTVAISPAQALARGIYWLAFLSDIGLTTLYATGVLRLIGGALCLGDGAGWYVAQAYGALPDPFTAAGTLITGNIHQSIGVKVASLE